MRDGLLGNMVDLTSLTHSWDAMRVSSGNINNLEKLHVIGQGCYIKRGKWKLTK